jgi:hypothetical protein
MMDEIDSPPIYAEKQNSATQGDAPEKATDLLADVHIQGGSNSVQKDATAEIPVIVKLNFRKPGNIYDDGKSMGIRMDPSHLVRENNAAIPLRPDSTLQDAKDLLGERIQRHFHVPFVGAGNYAILAVIRKDKRIVIADETDWKTSKPWLLDGEGELQYDFVPKEKAPFQSPEATGKAKKTKKGSRCIIQ